MWFLRRPKLISKHKSKSRLSWHKSRWGPRNFAKIYLSLGVDILKQNNKLELDLKYFVVVFFLHTEKVEVFLEKSSFDKWNELLTVRFLTLMYKDWKKNTVKFWSDFLLYFFFIRGFFFARVLPSWGAKKSAGYITQWCYYYVERNRAVAGLWYFIIPTLAGINCDLLSSHRVIYICKREIGLSCWLLICNNAPLKTSWEVNF